jgi:hypothetical protein
MFLIAAAGEPGARAVGRGQRTQAGERDDVGEPGLEARNAIGEPGPRAGAASGTGGSGADGPEPGVGMAGEPEPVARNDGGRARDDGGWDRTGRGRGMGAGGSSVGGGVVGDGGIVGEGGGVVWSDSKIGNREKERKNMGDGKETVPLPNPRKFVGHVT